MQILRTFKARLAAAMLCGFAAVPFALHAQDFPTQPVKLVVPFPPGGTTDILARQLATELQQRWGKPVLVENRSGASGTIFSEQLAHMPADGHTLMLTATHHVINPALYKNLKYDTRADFTPIALVATVPNVLVVHPSFPARSVAELIALAKAQPGRLNFGSSGTGGANHLSGELFKSMAGVTMVHVPYKGAAPALNDTIAGHAQLMFPSLFSGAPQVKNGKLRALAVAGPKRLSTMPDVPTLKELGVDVDVSQWYALFAPARTPAPVIEKLNKALVQVLADPDIIKRIETDGADARSSTPAELAALVKADLAKWKGVVQKAGLSAD